MHVHIILLVNKRLDDSETASLELIAQSDPVIRRRCSLTMRQRGKSLSKHGTLQSQRRRRTSMFRFNQLINETGRLCTAYQRRLWNTGLSRIFLFQSVKKWLAQDRAQWEQAMLCDSISVFALFHLWVKEMAMNWRGWFSPFVCKRGHSAMQGDSRWTAAFTWALTKWHR